MPVCQALGADLVFTDDSDGLAAAKAALAERGLPAPMLALNAVGGDSALRLMDLLGPGGTHITYGAMARQSLKVPNGMLIFRALTLRGFWLTLWKASVKPEGMDKQAFFSQTHEADHTMFDLVKKYRGSISAEHGIGLLKRDFLPYSRSPAEIAAQRAVKNALDPKNILNPVRISKPPKKITTHL